jgi:hypothetical protein
MNAVVFSIIDAGNNIGSSREVDFECVIATVKAAS